MAIIGPSLYRVLFESKKHKLAQYSRKVWKLEAEQDDVIADQAITLTVNFFVATDKPTKISERTADFETAIPFIRERFKNRNWVMLGERKNIDLERWRQILEISL